MRGPNGMTTWGRRLTLLSAFVVGIAACSSGPAASATPASTPTSSATSGASTEPSATACEPQTVAIALSQQIFSYSPIYVAAAKGFWTDENLTVDITFFKSGSESQQAVLGDAVLLGAGGYTEPITLAAQGVPAVAFGFVEGALPYKLMAQKDITTIDQLAGKVLGVSRVGALSDQVTRIALSKAGFDPNKATYQAAGGSPDRFAALQAGAVSATVLDSPTYLLAQEAGFNTLMDVAKELEGFPYELLWAKKATIDANPDTFLCFMRGYIRGAQYFKDPANKDEVISIIAKALGQEEATSKLGYETTFDDFPADGAASLEGLRLALDGTQKFGNIPNADKVTAEQLYYPDLQKQALESLK